MQTAYSIPEHPALESKPVLLNCQSNLTLCVLLRFKKKTSNIQEWRFKVLWKAGSANLKPVEIYKEQCKCTRT
jgi:hypothetical protein